MVASAVCREQWTQKPLAPCNSESIMIAVPVTQAEWPRIGSPGRASTSGAAGPMSESDSPSRIAARRLRSQAWRSHDRRAAGPAGHRAAQMPTGRHGGPSQSHRAPARWPPAGLFESRIARIARRQLEKAAIRAE